MKEVVPGVRIYSEFPRRYLNAYVVDDEVLVDSGTRWRRHRFLRELGDFDIEAHVLTHAHPDHQGKSAVVCREFDVPLICHPEERDAVETGNTGSPMPDTAASYVLDRFAGGLGHPVDRTLTEGDTVGGFEVVETPGNAAGHISLWRESDGTVILGDVVANIAVWTLRQGLHEVPHAFTVDPEKSFESAVKIADLEPDVICFGHGPPLRDSTKFQDFVSTLDQQNHD